MKNMNLVSKMVVAVLLILGSLSQSSAYAFNLESNDDRCVIKKLGGGERVPFPLRSANTKFELAENETYLLNGTIELSRGRTYFKVDFASQPWLATERMQRNPYFVLEGMKGGEARKSDGRSVQVAVIAKRLEVQDSETRQHLKLSLILPLNPIDQRRR